MSAAESTRPATTGYSVPGFVIDSAAALLSELKALAAPVTLHCPPLDLDVEDHATLAPQAVMRTRGALLVLEQILALHPGAADCLDRARNDSWKRPLRRRRTGGFRQ